MIQLAKRPAVPRYLQRGVDLYSRLGGWTLVELVLVLVILGILAFVTTSRRVETAPVNLESQAQRLASDLRRARLFASTQFRSVCAVITGDSGNWGYRFSEYQVSAGVGSCAASAIHDPLGGPFELTLSDVSSLSLTVSPVSGAPFRFRSNGSPSAAASFVLSAGGRTATISVAADSGRIAVTL